MQGRKTHEQQLRMLEGKPDVPSGRDLEMSLEKARSAGPGHQTQEDARNAEFPVSRGGMHQESRDHNKHNHQTQSGHKPQEPKPEQEKN